MAFETNYSGRPASSFTDYVTPIQPLDVSGRPAPYVVPGFNNTENSARSSYHSDIAPALANLTSEFLTVGGAVCGGIGGWVHAAAAKETTGATTEDAGAVVKNESEAAILPAVRFVKTQLTECLDWLPLWQNPSVKMALESGGRLCCKAVPALRGGLVGGIAGAITGYITGYAAGAAADWCIDRVVGTYNVFK